MARPVVCTPAAAEGLRASPLIDEAIASSPADVAAKVLANLNRGAVSGHRDYVASHYSWEANLSSVERLLVENSGRGRATRPLAAAQPT